MRYLHVTWLHDHPDEPVDPYSELDDESWEVRKVEVFRDGKAAFASPNESTGERGLGSRPFPDRRDREDDEFQPEEISKEEFERVWDFAHVPAATP